METVTITITRATVLSDMKVKSHAEVALLADPRERYIAELGTEKEQEAHQCITDAAAEIASVLRQFIPGEVEASASNAYDGTNDISYVLEVTTRKASGLANPLAKAIHAYIVDSALDKFYTSVSRADFAERHRAKLSSELTAIGNLVYHRIAPTYTPPTSPSTTPTTTDEDTNSNNP